MIWMTVSSCCYYSFVILCSVFVHTRFLRSRGVLCRTPALPPGPSSWSLVTVSPLAVSDSLSWLWRKFPGRSRWPGEPRVITDNCNPGVDKTRSIAYPAPSTCPVLMHHHKLLTPNIHTILSTNPFPPSLSWAEKQWNHKTINGFDFTPTARHPHITIHTGRPRRLVIELLCIVWQFIVGHQLKHSWENWIFCRREVVEYKICCAY